MQYYKDKNGEVYAYDEDQEPIKGLEIMTEEEVEIHLQPSPEQKKELRILELRQLLRDTDYVALSDYDQDKPEVITQRAEWREEIRKLEND
jgi:hypothetical protein